MPTPRLHGWPVGLARALSASGPLRWWLHRQMRHDYGFDAFRGLFPGARFPLADIERPLQAGPPRQWGDQQLGPPATLAAGREGALALRTAYIREEVTPVEVLAGLRRRIEARAFGASTHSPFVALDWETAEVAARESAERYHVGRALGPLDGIPLPIKDHHPMRGVPMQAGTSAKVISREDSAAVAALRAGGAVLFGKTHTTEWGMSPIGNNTHHLMPRNPHGSERAAGGSSTGAAVAVALGLSPVALGSDAGGSIRIPASLNGVLGLKPTYRRISRTGDLWGGNTVAHNGPLGQTVQDLIDFMTVASVFDPLDPAQAAAPDWPVPAPAWWRAAGRGVRGCRIGILRWAFADAPVEIAETCRVALAALEREGAILVDLDVPLVAHATAMGILIVGCEMVGGLLDLPDDRDLRAGEDVRLQLQLLRQVPVEDLLAAERMRPVLREQLARALREVDLLALPSTADVAPRYPLAEDRHPLLDGSAMRARVRSSFFANLAGLPAGSIPVGRVGDLPVGLQLVGDAWDEASVLAAMAQLERLGVSALPPPPAFARLGR